MMGRDKRHSDCWFTRGSIWIKECAMTTCAQSIALWILTCYGEVEKSTVTTAMFRWPPLIVKADAALSTLYVAQRTELMATLPERLDWLWFFGVDWT